jgi:hypothetical protein
VKNTRRLKRTREQATTRLHPVELATLVEASAAASRHPIDADAETVEMVALEAIELDGATAEPASPPRKRNAATAPLPGIERAPANRTSHQVRDSVAREDAETEEVIELARGSSQVPPPIVTARGPRRSRGRMTKLTR